ncbi:hypothetical protein LP419_27245 [Massilia sp. H-1]|nr:hypothetical protein LP419_27245 [Massilia sp. H-1]
MARLYLFDKYPKLRGRIKGALNFLSSNAGNERKESYQRLGLQVDTSKFRIVVIASAMPMALSAQAPPSIWAGCRKRSRARKCRTARWTW